MAHSGCCKFKIAGKERKFGVASTPKSCTSWASGHIGYTNIPRGLAKHEVKHGVKATKRRVTPKRLGRVNMRSTPRLWSSGPKGHES